MQNNHFTNLSLNGIYLHPTSLGLGAIVTIKIRIIILLVFFLNVSILSADVISVTSSIIKPSLSKKKFSLIMGGDVILGHRAGYLPQIGWEVKAGVRYSIDHIQLNGLVGYGPIKGYDWMLFGGSRTRTESRFFPHLLASYNGGNIHPYVLIGVGSGFFEVHSKVTDGESIIQSREIIWGYGGGVRYKNFIIGFRKYEPEVILSEEIGTHSTRYLIFNDRFQISIGFLFDLNN